MLEDDNRPDLFKSQQVKQGCGAKKDGEGQQLPFM